MRRPEALFAILLHGIAGRGKRLTMAASSYHLVMQPPVSASAGCSAVRGREWEGAGGELHPEREGGDSI